MAPYKTVRTAGEGEYEEKRSRFIGSIIPIKTEQEALDFIAKRRQQTFGARHNVYAYILRENNITRYSDDGEPHSTAGMPTLDVLRRQGLEDCCIVITRYFGGVLLGTGGLVRAYTAAAVAAVEAAGVALMQECLLCRIVCDYSDHRVAERVITDNGGRVETEEFTENVACYFWVTTELFSNLEEKLTETFGGKFAVEVIKTDYAEV